VRTAISRESSVALIAFDEIQRALYGGDSLVSIQTGKAVNPARLFVACCAAPVAIAVAFSVRTDIVPALKAEFGFTDTEIGQILGAGLWGFAVTLIVGGILLDKLGMGRLTGLPSAAI
jgi:hypothetical protein